MQFHGVLWTDAKLVLLQVSTVVLRASTDNTLDDLERAVDDGVNAYKVTQYICCYVWEMQQGPRPLGCCPFWPDLCVNTYTSLLQC